MSRRELPPGWFCEGQTDLTDLIGTERISGSMPAGDADRERARQRFYSSLRNGRQCARCGWPEDEHWSGGRHPEPLRELCGVCDAGLPSTCTCLPTPSEVPHG